MVKKGGGVVDALWAGTAFFAAQRALSFSDFLMQMVKYSVILALILAAVGIAATLLQKYVPTIGSIVSPPAPETQTTAAM